MARLLGLLLVVLGVGLAASFGSRLSPPEEAAAIAEGAATLSGEEAPEPPAVGPGERLSAWFSVSGLPFLGGVVLIVVGATISRVEARKALTAEPKGDSSKGPAVDFGQTLASLREAVTALGAEMARQAEGDWDATQARIEELAKDQLEPLIDAGPRVQAKYGLEAHAEIFSPLATAERRLNRAWSATVDRHWPEATSSVQGAAQALDQARAALAEYAASA